jgi:hypothetical protein
VIDTGHWKTKEKWETVPFGFIYMITNKTTNKKYIGKKQCLTIKKKPPLKGKKNKRHSEVETDWKDYTGSSKEMNEDILRLGKDNFIFEVVQTCSCKWDLAYEEAKLQFDNNILTNPEYYNNIINLRLKGKK